MELNPASSDDIPGEDMHAWISGLYPICRSITGDGVRQTLQAVRQRIPIEIHEVATGTPVFDWTVPNEWNIREAWVKDPDGRKIVDFADHSLHVLNYSVPVHETLALDELQAHLHSLPEHPVWIPYRTSYFQERWGFCLPHRQREALPSGNYEVYIDSTLERGHLTYGELVLPGKSQQEFLLSCHVCHPSLANDNLSSLAVSTTLAERLAKVERHYTYRFLFIPGTIGAITWLARNQESATNIRHGLVMACLGDAGCFHYKRSRHGDAEIDRVAEYVLQSSGKQHAIEDFVPYGYDERQYGSPGFNLPVGSLTRTPYGRFPEYHTSADNLDFVKPDALAESVRTYLQIIRVIEANAVFKNLNPYCEPQLGKRGLYETLGGASDAKERQLAMLWVLNLADGTRSLLDIACQAGVAFDQARSVAEALCRAELLVDMRP